MKLIVGNVTQEQDIEKGEGFLNLPYQLLDDNGVVVADRNQGFALDTQQEEIEIFLSRVIPTYKENVALYEGAQILQDKVDSANQVAEQFTGRTINE